MYKYAKLSIVLVTLSAGGWCAQRAFVLPEPSLSSRAQLGRWLVTRNVEKEPDLIQCQLVDRLQLELPDWDVSSAIGTLPAGRHEQLQANVDFLKYRWFVMRCIEFIELNPGQRPTFLDTQIAFVKLFQDLSQSGEDRSLFADIETWRDRVPLDVRLAVDESVNAAFMRWLQTCSLESLPSSTVSDIANRIADRLDCGIEIPIENNSSDHAKIWRTNANVLMRAWFIEQADKCNQLPTSDRRAFAHSVLDRVRGWKLSANMGEPMSSPNETLGDLARSIDAWINESGVEQQKSLRRFRGLIQQVLLSELLQGQRHLFR
jgi:hypothetical protein